MVEEKDTSAVNSDDLDALRVLLHNVKGISAVSSVTAYVPEESEE